MLVLSRKQGERVVFPSLGVSVQIVQCRGNVVRIGIEAPDGVRVFRAELADAIGASRQNAHAERNRLQRVLLSLHVIEQQLEHGRTAEAQATLRQLIAWMDGEEQPAPVHRPNKVRMLVVDDDSNERELLAGFLDLQGCECATASDGEDAMEYLTTHDRPDFVLLDMIMPRCDGPKTIDRIRSNPRLSDVRVFAISGADPEELGVKTGAQGVDAWFRKPLNPRRLWDAIAEGANKN
jgi:carbon storage regulator CsrA